MPLISQTSRPNASHFPHAWRRVSLAIVFQLIAMPCRHTKAFTYKHIYLIQARNAADQIYVSTTISYTTMNPMCAVENPFVYVTPASQTTQTSRPHPRHPRSVDRSYSFPSAFQRTHIPPKISRVRAFSLLHRKPGSRITSNRRRHTNKRNSHCLELYKCQLIRGPLLRLLEFAGLQHHQLTLCVMGSQIMADSWASGL